MFCVFVSLVVLELGLGHCLHHFYIWDLKSKGIFSGDAAGMYYAHADQVHQLRLCLPATTPVQFDPTAMAKTIQSMMALKPEKIYYTHFGQTDQAQAMLDEVLGWIPLYGNRAADHYRENRDPKALSSFLYQEIMQELAQRGVHNSKGLAGLEFDCDLNAQGVAAFVEFQEKKSSPA